MEILTLLKANLKHRKSSWISVFILMMIVSSILTSALSICANVTSKVSQANDDVGTGDIVAFISDIQFTDETRFKLEESASVEKINVVDGFSSTSTTVNGTKPDSAIFFTTYDSAEKNYDVFNDTADAFIVNPEPLKDGEIYLPLGMKKMCSCQNGDKVAVELSDRTAYFTIAGFIEDPFLGCDVIATKDLFITQNDLDMIIEETIAAYSTSSVSESSPITPIKMIHIFAAEEYKNDINAFSRVLNKETQIIDKANISITREESQTYTLLLPLLMCGVLFLFLAILMTVVGLVLSNNIGASIEMEYVNIGILKSQGFTKHKIRLVFLLQYLLPAILGSLVGFLLAFAVIDFVRPLFITISCVLVPNELLIGISMIVLLFILTLICLFIYTKTARVSKISPIKAISGGLEDIHFSSVLRTPVMGKTKSALGIKLAFRQLTSNIKQYIGICVILTFIVFYLSTCNALLKNFTVSFYDEMYGIKTADVCVNYNEHIEMRDSVEKDIAAVSAIDASYIYSEQEFFVDDVPYRMQVINDMSYLSHFIDGKLAEYDNELVITNFLSRKIGKTIGDKVTVSHDEMSQEFIICGVYDSIQFAGIAFAITFDAAKTLIPELEVNNVFYIVNDKTQVDNINSLVDKEYSDFGIETENAKRQNEGTVNAAMTVLNSMILFIFIIAIIFAVIVVWMVCTKSFLKERLNIGIYKAYGFSTFSLKMQFCFRYLIVAVTACIFGVTLYTFLGDALNLTTFMILGVTQFHAPLTPESYIIPPALICFFVFLASYITMGKINKVSTQELVTE